MPIAPDVYKKIVIAKLYMDENFYESIDLDRISREACLSRYHFHRLFTRIYRRTPHQYLTYKRVEQARQWLADKDLSVSEICNNVGFESIGSFSVLFKKEIGYAPQYYRNQAWLKKQQALAQPRKFIPHCFIETCLKA
ncbi:MAG TPA: AraC family transcriptional regulator [Puia sp.]|nr:AraC family transcriptional regulator [Puia sp.]